MKHEPIDDHAERKRISALIDRCGKEQTMKDTIYREDAIDACAYETIECYEARKAIRALPSADRLPSICLCKDCRKYKYDWCHKFANVVKPDDFCSYAERRTDDEH